MTDDRYKPAFDELYGNLNWIHDASKAIHEVAPRPTWGLNLGRVANVLIYERYPELRKFIDADGKPTKLDTPMSHRCETCGTKDGHEPGCVENDPPEEWGDPIAVDGKRPEWLKDGERIRRRDRDAVDDRNDGWGRVGSEHEVEAKALDWRNWVTHIRLPASHPYYLATSRGCAYWPGGKTPPADWDGEGYLKRGGAWCSYKPIRWEWIDTDATRHHDVIGYRRKSEGENITDDDTASFSKSLSEGEYFVIMQMGAMGFRYGPYTALEAGAIAKQCVEAKIPAYMSINMGGEFDWDFARSIGATANADWRGMDEAPQDGTVIIADVSGIETAIVWWANHEAWRRLHENGTTVLEHVEPTKWREQTAEEKGNG